MMSQRKENKDLKAAEREIDRPDTALDDQFTSFNKLEQKCRKCNKKYAVHANNAQSCVGHPGELELDGQSCARNIAIGMLIGAGIGSCVGILSYVIAKAIIAPTITTPAPAPGLQTLALSSSKAGAASEAAASAGAGASIGSLSAAAGTFGSASAPVSVAAMPSLYIGIGMGTAGAIGGGVKTHQSLNNEVGFKDGSYRWSCCGYHQSEETCDGRLSMHLPKPPEPEDDEEGQVQKWRGCPCGPCGPQTGSRS